MTSKSTPDLLPLIFLQLVQRAGDKAVSLGGILYSSYIFHDQGTFSLQLLSFELIH